MRKGTLLGLLAGALLFVNMIPALAGNAAGQDFSDLKKEVEDLRARLAQKKARPSSGAIDRAETLVSNKYGPNATVTTRDGRLRFGGLVQVWWSTIQNDNRDFRNTVPFGAAHTNEVSDNDTYRIRRAELKFTLDITPEITAVVMIDPTGQDEGNSFSGVPSNQGLILSGASGQNSAFGFFGGGQASPRNTVFGGGGSSNESGFGNPLDNGLTSNQIGRVRDGTTVANRLLQDAYINYHSPVIPHHDFTVGQFKPPMGEEGNRNSGQLDFVERAMINQFSNERDLGIMAHGTWWQGRFQYWLGAFDTAGSFHNTFASLQNRSDDNNAFDIAWKILVRPLWHDEKWGSLELGYSRQDGVHGESGSGFLPVGFALGGRPTVDGLSFEETKANRQYAWLWYRVGSETPMAGVWLRGEWAAMRDRLLPSIQARPSPFTRSGWYGAIGYRLSKSVWAENLKNGGLIKKFLHDTEFAFRFQEFGNLLLLDLARPNNRIDVFKTDITTIGLNYYWKGYNVRSQVNYLIVDEKGSGGTRIREVRNNVLIFNQQVQW